MDTWGPGRHFSSGRHTHAAVRRAGRRLLGLIGRIHPQYLLVLVAVLGLTAAGTIYATIQGREPVYAGVPPASSVSPSAAPAEATGPPPATGPATGPASGAGSPAAPPPAPPPVPATAPPPAPAAIAPPEPAIGAALDAEIDAVIQANSGLRVGVALIDVADGVVHEYGVRTKFVAASTGKILAAAAYYNLVETGQASLWTPMGGSTAGQQIRQMVQQSNNESWALILSAVGYRGLTNYAASLGITYDRSVNTLTPAEMARTLAELYSGRLLNAENTRQLLSYMQKTNYDVLIPAAAPPGVSVFHKYGLLNGYLHDASILVQGERAYVFVVYTLGQDMATRTRVIHRLTSAVTAGLF